LAKDKDNELATLKTELIA